MYGLRLYVYLIPCFRVVSFLLMTKVHMEDANAQEVEEAKRDLEDKLAQIISETIKKEHEYQSEQNVHVQVRSNCHFISFPLLGTRASH